MWQCASKHYTDIFYKFVLFQSNHGVAVGNYIVVSVDIVKRRNILLENNDIEWIVYESVQHLFVHFVYCVCAVVS